MSKVSTGLYTVSTRIPEHVQAKAEADASFWFGQIQALLEGMRKRGLDIRVEPKEEGFRAEKWWERVLFTVGKLIPGFARATQVMGTRIYLSTQMRYDVENRLASWRTFRVILHECTHVLQWHRFLTLTWGWKFGAYALWGAVYLSLLPLLFTIRSIWEREAYLDGHAALVRVGLTRHTDRYCEWVSKLFKAPMYAWMDPIWAGGFRHEGKSRALLQKGYVTDVERFSGHLLEIHPAVARYEAMVLPTNVQGASSEEETP